MTFLLLLFFCTF